jgi:hypothetical protein
LGIVAAGGLGALLLRDHLGSDFLSRADKESLLPLTRLEMRMLAQPFDAHAAALEPETLDAVRLASGGNPALVTYAYQHLWTLDDRDPDTVTRLFADFGTRNGEFVRSVHRSVMDSSLTGTPRLVYEFIRDRAGAIPRRELLQHSTREGTLQLELDDTLELLSCAGLIQLDSSIAADPLVVRPIQSILALPTERSAGAASPRQRLRADLLRLLGLIHRTGPDYYRQGGELVPEAVFSAALCLGLRTLGWRAEREPLEGGGFIDVKVELEATPMPSYALIEVKRWGHAEHQKAQQQVLDYWTVDVRAGAVVMFGSYVQRGRLDRWTDEYHTTCLESHDCSVAPLSVAAPLHAGFTATSKLPSGQSVNVEHLLLNLPRRPG